MNTQKHIISVLLPVYNGGTYLRGAIESILNQTYGDFELLLINDGSTDNSEEIILSFSDPRIRYIKNEANLGLIKTLNKGIELSEGKYIARMDADDVSLPGRFKKQVEFMEANPGIGVAGSEYYSFSETKFKKVRAFTEPEVLRSLLIFKSCLCHPSVIIRKSVLIENNIRFNENYKHVEDYEFWVQLSKVTKLSNVKGFLLKYRTHDAQVSNIHTGTQKDNSEVVRENYLRSLGFSFTEKDLQANTLVATNALITSEEKLGEIENWLLKLVDQNKQLNSIKAEHFNFMMGKAWFDSCGITNLGMIAYNKFFKSALATHYPLSSKQKVKLLAKCTLRRFRK